MELLKYLPGLKLVISGKKEKIENIKTYLRLGKIRSAWKGTFRYGQTIYSK